MDWVDNKPKNTKNLNGNNSSFHVTLSATLDLEIDACLHHKYIKFDPQGQSSRIFQL